MNKYFHIGESGRTALNEPRGYTICDERANAGMTAVDLPHIAGNTFSFDAKKKRIVDSAENLGSINTGDIITIIGETLNAKSFTVTRGGGVAHCTVKEDLASEPAGEFITIAKRAFPTNAVVTDLQSGLTWHRTPSHVEKIGPNSDGQLAWYDEDLCFEMLPENSSLQMIGEGKNFLRIVGGASLKGRFFPGALIRCAGFENDINNAPGLLVEAVAISGENLSLKMWTNCIDLISEDASGSCSIKIICQSIFAYAAAANAASLGGYSDWRIPTDVELRGLCDMSRYPAIPDESAFPEWTTRDWFWSAVTYPSYAAHAMLVHFLNGYIVNNTKSSLYYCALVRG